MHREVMTTDSRQQDYVAARLAATCIALASRVRPEAEKEKHPQWHESHWNVPLVKC